MKKNTRILFAFILIVFGCGKQEEAHNPKTTEVINTFYGDALEYKESYELLRDLSKNIGQRLSGSEGAKKAVEWSKKVMENYKFDTVYLQEVMVPHWERGNVEECFFLVGGKKTNLRILGAGGTVSTPSEGITAEVVEVMSLDEVDQLGEDGVKGKIVFYNKGFNPRYINQGASYGQTGFQRRSGAVKAAEYGAVASVFRSLSSIEDDVPPKNIITVGGHLDSWDVGEGAHDDGAGCVHSIGALRLFQKQNIQPKNTIRAVMFMNEENGLRGGNEYANIAVELGEKHIAAIESDASGYVPRGFGFSGSDEQLEKIQGWLKYFDKNTISYFSKGGGGADIGPLHRKTGTPMFGLSIDGQKYFEMHHTEKDVFELVNARELELGTASLASLVYLIDINGL